MSTKDGDRVKHFQTGYFLKVLLAPIRAQNLSRVKKAGIVPALQNAGILLEASRETSDRAGTREDWLLKGRSQAISRASLVELGQHFCVFLKVGIDLVWAVWGFGPEDETVGGFMKFTLY